MFILYLRFLVDNEDLTGHLLASVVSTEEVQFMVKFNLSEVDFVKMCSSDGVMVSLQHDLYILVMCRVYLVTLKSSSTYSLM